MHKKRICLSGLLIVLSGCLCLAQSKLVSVNYSTGTANVTIPLFNISYGAVNVPVALSYSATGIKTKDVEGTAGMGWNLIAGGAVSRVLRGLPDDGAHSAFISGMSGWMYNNSQSLINAFGIQNNGSTCSNETADISYITGHFSYKMDTEPDLFMANAPGLSCELVYDHNINNFRPITYQDLKISYTTGSDSTITSFTIINDKGIKYVFSNKETTWLYNEFPAGSMQYFANAYTQYSQHGMNYTSAWYVTSITDINGQGVQFFYTTAPPRSGSDPVTLYIGGTSTPTTEYTTVTTTTTPLLNDIAPTDGDDYTAGAVTLNWDTAQTRSSGITMINSVTGMGRTAQLAYSGAYYSGNPSGYSRSFLRGLTESGCSSPVNYTFSYAGETLAPGGFYYTTTLPDSSSKYFDYWGYTTSIKDSVPTVWINPSDTTTQTYNIAGNLPGSSYVYSSGLTLPGADSTVVTAGMLDTIRYATGGMTTLTYQINDYYDATSGQTAIGGGVRIRQIADHDGINEADNIVRNYSYTNPATGKSSGKPLSLPAYAFTRPYGGEDEGVSLWEDVTVTSMYDLSEEDHSIMYTYVKESRTHAGSTVYQFYMPATNWDKTATPGCSGCSTVEWRPQTEYVGRTSCTGTYGPIRNNSWSYPFAPNPNYDFERGLLQSVTTYNDAGTKVSESDYTYQRSYSSLTKIPALRFEYNGGSSGVLSYSKYNIFTTTSELTSKVVNTVYDSPTLSQAQTSTVNYAYTSSNHKLLTQQTTTNSDGTTLINNIKYTKDYGATSSTNANINALYNLVQENVNTPVETWSQVQNGSTTYTTSASLTLFNAFSNGHSNMYLPSQHYVLTQPNGQTSFTQSSISGTTFTKDAGYQPIPVHFVSYDIDGSLVTVDDGRHHRSTTATDHITERPVLQASNTAYNEFAFQNFDMAEMAPYNLFLMSGTPLGVNGHTGAGNIFSTSQTLSTETAITKDTLAGNYIFSCWINSGTVTGNVTLTIKFNSTTFTKTFTAAGNNWQYYEWKLTPPANTFTVSVQTSATISIDDVACYPDNAEISWASFDPVTLLPTSGTNTNGISTYYSYDVWGRLLYTYDRYKNILQKNTYVTQADQKSFHSTSSSYINVHGNTFKDTSFYLTAVVAGCYGGYNNTYTWNFNDGTGNIITTVPTSPTHSYDTVKTYTATVKVNSPMYGIVTLTMPIPVTIPPPTDVPLNFVNGTGSGNRDISSYQFYQGGVLVYSFPPSSINGSTVKSGTYTVEVNTTSHAAGYASIQLTTPNGKEPTVIGCSNYAGSGVQTYTFTISLPLNCPGLTLNESATACGGGE